MACCSENATRPRSSTPLRVAFAAAGMPGWHSDASSLPAWALSDASAPDELRELAAQLLPL